MTEQPQLSAEFTQKAHACAMGDLRAMEWMGEYFNAQLSEDFREKEQALLAGAAGKEVARAMADWLSARPEEEFAAQARGFWLNRAAFYGSESAREILRQHPVFLHCCFLSQAYYSGHDHCGRKCTSARLRQLGLLSFREKGVFYLNSMDEHRFFCTEGDGGSEGPDSDGYGREELYHYCYYDAFFNPVLQLNGWSSTDLRYGLERSVIPKCRQKAAEFEKEREAYWLQAADPSARYRIPSDVVIEDGVVIGIPAHCDTPLDLVLPDTVREIAPGAFSACRMLRSITLPDTIEKIGDRAFYLSGLERIAWPAHVPQIPNAAFCHCHRLKQVSIPDGVTQIGDDAFANCHELEEAAIPDSVTDIGHGAFQNCRKLKSITIPSSVKEIHPDAFAGLKNVTVSREMP